MGMKTDRDLQAVEEVHKKYTNLLIRIHSFQPVGEKPATQQDFVDVAREMIEVDPEGELTRTWAIPHVEKHGQQNTSQS